MATQCRIDPGIPCARDGLTVPGRTYEPSVENAAIRRQNDEHARVVHFATQPGMGGGGAWRACMQAGRQVGGGGRQRNAPVRLYSAAHAGMVTTMEQSAREQSTHENAVLFHSQGATTSHTSLLEYARHGTFSATPCVCVSARWRVCEFACARACLCVNMCACVVDHDGE